MVEVDSGRSNVTAAALEGNERGSRAGPKLLFLVPFTPRRDVQHGGRVVAQLLFRLAEGHRIGLVYRRGPGAEPLEDELKQACELVREVIPGRPFRRNRHRLNVLLAPIRGLPSEAAAVYDARFAAACREAVRTWSPDVVQVEHDNIAYLGRGLRRADADVVLLLTCHEPGMVAAADQARVTRGRRRLAHRIDASAWRRYWSRTLPAFDAVITFTDRDGAAITAADIKIRTRTIALGVDIPPEPLGTAGGDPNVLFVGGYVHPPNTDAALRLIRSIMPAVRRRKPGLRLVIAGAGPGRDLIAAAGAHDEVTGSVPEISPFMQDATLLALPIRLGGGMRVKLLEAFAAEKAVVTSRLAATGLDLVDGKQVVFAEDDEEFADAIVALIDDPPRRRDLGREARRYAIENLGWDARVGEWDELYRELRGAAPNRQR
jgi:glycosyltransferase involved in cell wall biosynthesis